LVRGRRRDTEGQPPGGGRRPGAPHLRQCGGRSRGGQRVPRRSGAEGRSHGGDLHRRSGAGAGGTAARGPGSAAPRRPGGVDRLRGASAGAGARGWRGHRGAAAAAPSRSRGAVLRSGESMSGVGLVSLVGAGPGDPDLLTLRAVARLQEANVVLYDALVDRAALRHAPRARWAYVGKRAGRHSISQCTIERLMIRQARRGARVVRLKSGAPFVLGRGGEEALALAAAGIPCEVVPGVSAAVAAPGLSGIPVTHRGLSSAFLVVSGHAEEAFAPPLR